MWERIGSFFSTILRYLSPQRADFEALITRYDTLLSSQKQFYEAIITAAAAQIATIRTDLTNLEASRQADRQEADKRFDVLGAEHGECRKALASTAERLRQVEEDAGRAFRAEQEKVRELRKKVSTAKKMLIEANKVKKICESPQFREKTLKQTEVLIDEHKTDTKLQASEGEG